MHNTWLSAHLFYAGDLNHLLHHLVTPLLQSTGYDAFFIRYWEGGPHIRLRLYVKQSDVSAVKALLETQSSAFFSQYPSRRDDARYKNILLLPNDTLQYISYEPEIARYGNAQSINQAEQQFTASSCYVLQQLRDEPVWNDSVALLHAIRLNMGILYALQMEEEMALDICRRFIRTWLPGLYDNTRDAQAQEQHYMALLHTRFAAYATALTTATTNLWEDMVQGEGERFLQTFIERNKAIFCHYREAGFDKAKLQDITGSFIHMGHNRLGVSNLDEAYIMFFTFKCLEHIYANIQGSR